MASIEINENIAINKDFTDNSRRLSIAPMLDWTDRHFRYMARLISKHTWLYSEMINANAIVYGNTKQLLEFNKQENPLAIQLGGSDPKTLAKATKTAFLFGYDEVNLNCGCPSPRVQHGAFGACLMHNVQLVTDCLNAMQEVVPIPITIKHRIGLDKQTDYQPLADFVGTLRHQTSCRIFIVHARNAWLHGLSPKDNRTIPPLRYDFVYRLKQEFPDLQIIINGGIQSNLQITNHLKHVDGVMIGREAYHNPMIMQNWDQIFYSDPHKPINHENLVMSLLDYAHKELAESQISLHQLTKHYLGIMHGLAGARQWRRLLSNPELLKNNQADLILSAWQEIKNNHISH